MAREIIVEEYNPNWNDKYIKTQDILKTIYDDILIDIQHIGSTAINGLAAKPVIDVLVVVKDIDLVDKYDDMMIQQGFKPMGEFAIPQRRYFQKTLDNNEFVHTHHIHIYQDGNPKYHEELIFRDYLRVNKEVLDNYAELKKELSIQFKDDPSSYSMAKSDFISSVINDAREYFLDRKL